MTQGKINMRKNSYFEVIGNIASGKSTLLASLKKKEIRPVFEQFEKNPFLESFYTDPAFFSFETELAFLLQHYHSIKTNLALEQTLVCDFSLTLDFAYAEMNLSDTRCAAFSSVMAELILEIGQPSGIIYIKCKEDALLKRIRNRNRKMEEAISIDYLSSLTSFMEKNLEKKQKTIPILEIDNSNNGLENISNMVVPIMQFIRDNS